MPEEPETTDLPSDAGVAAEGEAKPADETPEAEGQSEPSPEAEPSAGAEQKAGGEAQPEVEVQSADAQLESPPTEEDRLVEEQMLAQLAEAEVADKQAEPAASDIREPEMDFPQSEAQPATAQPVEFPQLKETAPSAAPRNYDMLLDVKLPVSIELGRTTMLISDILALGAGSLVELDKLAGEPVNLLVNDKVIAQGEVVVVDENFGIRITNLISPQERIKSL